jgi:dTDP-glucose 4,6-dehydratase
MTELDWWPSVTFEQGIQKTIDWYLKNKKWLSNVASGEYQKYYDAMYSNR